MSRASSMELGELEASPDLRDSPHIQLYMADDSEGKELFNVLTDKSGSVNKRRNREEDENLDDYDDHLNIQPPQPKLAPSLSSSVVRKEKKSLSHRHKEGKYEDGHSSHDKYHSKHSSKMPSQYDDKPRSYGKYSLPLEATSSTLPSSTSSSSSRDILKKSSLPDHDREYDEMKRKKSSYEKEHLAKLEKERRRIEGESQRHLVKIQRERDLDREMDRKYEKRKEYDNSNITIGSVNVLASVSNNSGGSSFMRHDSRSSMKGEHHSDERIHKKSSSSSLHSLKSSHKPDNQSSSASLQQHREQQLQQQQQTSSSSLLSSSSSSSRIHRGSNERKKGKKRKHAGSDDNDRIKKRPVDSDDDEEGDDDDTEILLRKKLLQDNMNNKTTTNNSSSSNKLPINNSGNNFNSIDNAIKIDDNEDNDDDDEDDDDEDDDDNTLNEQRVDPKKYTSMKQNEPTEAVKQIQQQQSDVVRIKISDSPFTDHSTDSIPYLHPPKSKFEDEDDDEDDSAATTNHQQAAVAYLHPPKSKFEDEEEEDVAIETINRQHSDTNISQQLHHHRLLVNDNGNNSNHSNRSNDIENNNGPHRNSTMDELRTGKTDDDGDNDDDDDEDNTSSNESPNTNSRIRNLPIFYPALQGCRNVEEFHCLNRIEEGTYGVVYRAIDMKTSEIVALKRLKMEKEKEGFPITSLREINTLLKAQHINVVTVREIVVGCNMDKIYIVMDYIEHDLKSLMESMKEPFLIGEVKTLMLQLLRGVDHLHDNWIVHRDLKTSNLLLSHKGILKIGDFGLAREYGSPLKPYTPIVVTLWYRAPELLLGTKLYSTAVDMWSVGCIFGEFLLKKPLFPGKSEVDELNRIFRELGSPNEKIWPGVNDLPVMQRCTFTEHPFNNLKKRFDNKIISDQGFELMNSFLTYNPEKRISADEALKHSFFNEVPLPVEPSMFPTWPAKSELAKTRIHGNSPKPPSGGKAYAKLLGDDDVIGLDTGFQLNATQNVTNPSKAAFTLKF